MTKPQFIKGVHVTIERLLFPAYRFSKALREVSALSIVLMVVGLLGMYLWLAPLLSTFLLLVVFGVGMVLGIWLLGVHLDEQLGAWRDLLVDLNVGVAWGSLAFLVLGWLGLPLLGLGGVCLLIVFIIVLLACVPAQPVSAARPGGVR